MKSCLGLRCSSSRQCPVACRPSLRHPDKGSWRNCQDMVFRCRTACHERGMHITYVRAQPSKSATTLDKVTKSQTYRNHQLTSQQLKTAVKKVTSLRHHHASQAHTHPRHGNAWGLSTLSLFLSWYLQ